MDYAPRLTFSYESLQRWISRVAMVSEKVLFYEHSDDPANVHIHGIIRGCSVAEKTLKNWVKETLGLTPTGTQWTFPQTYKDKVTGERIAVNDEFVKYMSKGKYDPVYNKGYSEEFIADQKSKGFDKKDRKVDKKQTAAERYYNEFVKWLWEKSNHDRVLDLDNYEVIKKAAYRYMMIQFSMPMPYQLSLYKASVMRFCYDFNVPLPEKVEQRHLGI